MIELALIAVLAAEVEPSTVHLVAVGANRGLDADGPLLFAHADARSFANVLLEAGGVEADNARVLISPSPAAVLDAIAALSTRTQPDDIVHFYYSGHGDRKSLHLSGARLGLSELQTALDAVPARVRLVFIDACQSIEASRSKGLVPDAGFAIDLRRGAQVSGTVTLRAASEGEAAQESGELGSAVFTHAMVVGLRGAADVDGDLRVSLFELYRYAYRQTVLRSSVSTGEVMHPTADLELSGAGELILSRPVASRAALVVPPDKDVRYLVFHRPSGALLAEVWADPERPLQLPTPPGTYLVHRRAPAGSGAREFTLEPGDRKSVKDGRFQRLPVPLLTDKGGHLKLVSHELSISVGGNYRLGFGQLARLGWSLGRPHLRLGVGVQVGRSSYEGSTQSFETTEIDGELLVSWRWSYVELTAAAFVRGLQVRGQLQGEDVLEGTGLITDSSSWGLGLGPRLRLGHAVDLGSALALELGVVGALLIAPERDGEGTPWRVRPEMGLEVGLRWSL